MILILCYTSVHRPIYRHIHIYKELYLQLFRLVNYLYNFRIYVYVMHLTIITLFNSLSASLLLNIFLSFEVGIAHAIANFK